MNIAKLGSPKLLPNLFVTEDLNCCLPSHALNAIGRQEKGGNVCGLLRSRGSICCGSIICALRLKLRAFNFSKTRTPRREISHITCLLWPLL